jgi:FtsP/CotA-like multicopper oxidase with cupredoxin domain
MGEVGVAPAFARDIAGLPMATTTPEIHLADGDTLELRISPVAQRIGDLVVRRLAYNGSVPGPVLRVREGSEIEVRVTNDGDVPGTVHWHGLRLENRYDGVPDGTQAPIEVGRSFTYRVRFPDPGLYWYHPHLREDYAQDMGLYGSIVVEPAQVDYWPEADREVVLTVDDVLVEDGELAPFDRSRPDRVAMGRFGNVLLVNGQPTWSLAARRDETVRLYLTNAANTRVFNLAIVGAAMKLVGGDSGRIEREAMVEEVLIAPSERAVVDVLFDRPGEASLEHRTPSRAYPLGRIAVHDRVPVPGAAKQFRSLRRAPEFEPERAALAAELARPPDKVLALVAEMANPEPTTPGPSGAQYACPMHPGLVSQGPGRCSQCGMRLLPISPEDAARGVVALATSVTTPHPEHADGASHVTGGIEWEDSMAAINRDSTPATIRWLLVDRQTGKANAEIDWSFRVGDRVKIRLQNEMESDHPMHHPFHIHGAGRFLVLARDGRAEPTLAWKDSVLIRAGEVVDILLEVSNPGRWMAHCHIAEHAEAGMMFSFDVISDRETPDEGKTDA